MRDEHLHEVEKAFNSAAAGFDGRYRNPIVRWTRKRNLALLKTTFPAGTNLVELGCGAGEDAVALASEGRNIFAVDHSAAMVEATTRRAAIAGLSERVKVVQGDSSDLQRLLTRCPWGRLDGAYASFSLFTEEDLRRMAQVVHGVLPPGAAFACTLGNRLPLAEWALYAALLRPRRAIQRLAQPRLQEIYGHQVRIHEYFVREARRAFLGYFTLREVVGLPVFLPPVYLKDFYGRLGPLQEPVERLDRTLSDVYPFNHLGESTFYRFRRNPA